MGKRYHCDYCDKTMVAAPAIVKTHNKGLIHQKLVQEHYRQFKDPETILHEEASKKPCSRYAKGDCQFGAICRFSHYTEEEINYFEKYVASRKTQNILENQPSFEDLYQKLQDNKAKRNHKVGDQDITLYDSNGVTHILPWSYNNLLDSYGENLPPSIKKICLEDFKDAQSMEWG